jgi:hypothetical protein
VKTEKLIQVLVADESPRGLSLGKMIFLSLAAGFVVAALPFWYVHGSRPDIASAVVSPRFLFKVGEVLLLAGAAAILAMRLLRPGADARVGWFALVLPPVFLMTAVAIELYLLPSQEWRRNLVGDNSYICLASVFLLSLPLLGAALFAMKDGAPTRPPLTGAVAGLLSGGLAASIYAVQCTDDSPLFVATWYVLAIVAVTALGAAAGNRVLRW